MKSLTGITAIMMTDLMLIAVSFTIFTPAPAKAETNIQTTVQTAATPNPIPAILPQTGNTLQNNPTLISQWIVLSALFNPQNQNAANNGNTMGVTISQWIALNWLFNGNNNFNKLDQVSKWIVLNGLFNTTQPYQAGTVR